MFSSKLRKNPLITRTKKDLQYVQVKECTIDDLRSCADGPFLVSGLYLLKAITRWNITCTYTNDSCNYPLMIHSNVETFEDALSKAFGENEPKRSRRILKKLNAQRLPPSDPVAPGKVPKLGMSLSDSDDDLEIVTCIDAIKWFYPVDRAWQHEKCSMFGLKLKKELNFGCDDPVPATPPMEIHEIEGDGNCYFRCLSYLITGSDKSHKLLRHKLVKFMRENEKMVEGLGGPLYLKQSMMWQDGMWPTEVEIYVSACMLDTDIYTYIDEKWLRFSSSGKLEISDKVDRAIYLQNKENVHYDVVVQVQEPKLLPPSRVYTPRRAVRKKPERSPFDLEKIVQHKVIDIEKPEPIPRLTLELPSSSVSNHTIDLDTFYSPNNARMHSGPRKRLDLSILKSLD